MDGFKRINFQISNLTCMDLPTKESAICKPPRPFSQLLFILQQKDILVTHLNFSTEHSRYRTKVKSEYLL